MNVECIKNDRGFESNDKRDSEIYPDIIFIAKVPLMQRNDMTMLVCHHVSYDVIACMTSQFASRHALAIYPTMSLKIICKIWYIYKILPTNIFLEFIFKVLLTSPLNFTFTAKTWLNSPAGGNIRMADVLIKIFIRHKKKNGFAKINSCLCMVYMT